MIDGQGVFYAEYAAAAALQAVEMGAASKSFTQIAGKCAYICAFAAGHPHDSARQPESGVVGHIYPA